MTGKYNEKVLEVGKHKDKEEMRKQEGEQD
jgi:hypothetical protein